MLRLRNKETYELTFGKLNQGALIFKIKPDNEQTSLDQREVECKVVESANARGVLVQRQEPQEGSAKPDLIEAQPGERAKSTKRLERLVNRDKLPAYQIRLGVGDSDSRRNKLDEGELKEELFDHFTDRPEMSFDEIQKLVDQPRGYLESILKQICEGKQKKNKMMYTLKPEYTNTSKPESKPVKKLKK